MGGPNDPQSTQNLGRLLNAAGPSFGAARPPPGNTFARGQILKVVKSEANQGSPLPASHSRAVVPPHIFASQPAPAPQQGQAGRAPRDGIPRGFTRAQTQLPMMNHVFPKFQNATDARSYTDTVFWRPFTKSHGVPTTDQERLQYVKKIHDAMVDLDYVSEIDTADALKFWATNGKWCTQPGCIEAVAHRIVDICVNLHTRGASNINLKIRIVTKDDTTDSPLMSEDVSFTFAQRIHFMAHLLRH